MAAFNGTNYASSIAIPLEQLPVGEVSGKVRMCYDKFVCAQDIYAIGDTINMGQSLPIGARIVDAVVSCPSLGTTGIFNLGIEGGDVDYFVALVDAGGQADKQRMASEAGLLIKGTAAIQPCIKFTEATDAADEVEIEMAIFYVLE